MNLFHLLWMHNLQDFKVIWPSPKGKKEQAIKDNKKPKVF